MSFSSEAKAELCQQRPDKKCCALAESYGVLLYCNTFSAQEIRIITASPEFAARLPRLFKRAFGLGFDVLPKEGTAGKSSFKITDRDKLKKIFDAFGAEIDGTVSHHINFGVIEDDCCRASFIPKSATILSLRRRTTVSAARHIPSCWSLDSPRRRRSAAGTGCCTSSRQISSPTSSPQSEHRVRR